MKVTDLKPCNHLAQLIDAYWELKGEGNCTIWGGVIPDGCIDVIINMGEDYIIESEDCILKSEKAYLGGAITEFKAGKISPDTHLVGVRFKPAAFSCFYSFSSLHQATDCCVEIDGRMVPDIKTLKNNVAYAFDSFYSCKLIQPKQFLLPIVESITKSNGSVSVKNLAKENYTTVRQLERNFKYHIGLSPKEFINITRFQYARDMIAYGYRGRTLFDIAFECGYYDHAHLSNAIKRYSGVSPSELKP